jgi:hypothetical protein
MLFGYRGQTSSDTAPQEFSCIRNQRLTLILTSWDLYIHKYNWSSNFSQLPKWTEAKNSRLLLYICMDTNSCFAKLRAISNLFSFFIHPKRNPKPINKERLLYYYLTEFPPSKILVNNKDFHYMNTSVVFFKACLNKLYMQWCRTEKLTGAGVFKRAGWQGAELRCV